MKVKLIPKSKKLLEDPEAMAWLEQASEILSRELTKSERHYEQELRRLLSQPPMRLERRNEDE